MRPLAFGLLAASYALSQGAVAVAQEETGDGAPPVVADMPKTAEPGEYAQTAAEMKAYTEEIGGTDLTFKMVPIPGGEFTIGSPEDEEGRGEGEGPQRRVSVSPFWMADKEVTWDEYEVFLLKRDEQRRKLAGIKPSQYDLKADAVTRPTKAYTDMTFDMGHDGFPAICMTHLSAKMYCKWLSEKTGHFYRLPTEAEWEFAARAGSQTAYHFGDDAEKLDEYAWSDDNAEWTYHPVGMKKPNAFGLYDMHGNVNEWTLDQYDPNFYATFPADKVTKDPYNIPKTIYPRTVRGGSWDQYPEELRSAARMPSTNDWKSDDPQIPQSIWWMTNSTHVGFRVMRPLHEPTEEEKLAQQLIPRPEDVPEWGLREGFIDD
ncbi:formylglycine-generating enzyme family protein [Alienimonas californiensis]|uniref:formylglycine-generating enzyme family protein n=1 Tax=Alienimonas californiensis TaxID=2527989 RepID=UPI0013FCFAD6|nr:SUMF1/EgtB/PvdO family nonheme iron enzyme [Alienimonas californiensis]